MLGCAVGVLLGLKQQGIVLFVSLAKVYKYSGMSTQRQGVLASHSGQQEVHGGLDADGEVELLLSLLLTLLPDVNGNEGFCGDGGGYWDDVPLGQGPTVLVPEL